MTDDQKPKARELLDRLIKDNIQCYDNDGEPIWKQMECVRSALTAAEARIEELEARCEKAEESNHFYHREWESACESYNDAREERNQLKEQNAMLIEALESIRDIQNTSWPDRIFVAKQTAHEALKKIEGNGE